MAHSQQEFTSAAVRGVRIVRLGKWYNANLNVDSASGRHAVGVDCIAFLIEVLGVRSLDVGDEIHEPQKECTESKGKVGFTIIVHVSSVCARKQRALSTSRHSRR